MVGHLTDNNSFSLDMYVYLWVYVSLHFRICVCMFRHICICLYVHVQWWSTNQRHLHHRICYEACLWYNEVNITKSDSLKLCETAWNCMKLYDAVWNGMNAGWVHLLTFDGSSERMHTVTCLSCGLHMNWFNFKISASATFTKVDQPDD